MTPPAGRARATAIVLLTITAAARAELRADELLLLVNKNVPESQALAEQYAKARNVPAARIFKISTASGEDISADDYEKQIAKPVREYLATPPGAGVRCLVSFFGLPLRVGGHTATPAEQAEVARLRQMLLDLDAKAAGLALAMDDAATSIGVTPAEGPAQGVAAARQHIAETERRVQAALTTSLNPARQQAVVERFKAAQKVSIDVAAAAVGAGPATAPASQVELQALFGRQRDAAARESLRQQVAAQAGAFAVYQIVEQQFTLINADDTDAAVDNELPLVRLPDYARFRWQPNPLNFRAGGGDTVPVLMVSRIDAPTAALTARLIDDTIATEAAGLAGKVVFDSRGIAPLKDGKPDAYGAYDQTVRDAAAFVKDKTKLTVVTDDREALLPPRSATGTALYCGWYSLRQYIPSCTFVRGAVAYHVASYELLSLHEPREKGWVANLLKEGVVATLGPVAEPYLSSFPRPDEFYPLLLTGRPTLAEAYWATCPMTSWKMTLIGDPLYRPYARTPPLATADLSPPLQEWLGKIAATRPAGR